MVDQQSTEELRATLARYRSLLANTQEKRQAALAAGNREIAGKLHQAEREWTRRITAIEARLSGTAGSMAEWEG